jgi:hypothetical protein
MEWFSTMAQLWVWIFSSFFIWNRSYYTFTIYFCVCVGTPESPRSNLQNPKGTPFGTGKYNEVLLFVQGSLEPVLPQFKWFLRSPSVLHLSVRLNSKLTIEGFWVQFLHKSKKKFNSPGEPCTPVGHQSFVNACYTLCCYGWTSWTLTTEYPTSFAL